MSEPTGVRALFAVEKRARHQKGVVRTPIRLEKVTSKRTAAASPFLLAVNTVEERVVVGSTDKNRSQGRISAGIQGSQTNTIPIMRRGESRKIQLWQNMCKRRLTTLESSFFEFRVRPWRRKMRAIAILVVNPAFRMPAVDPKLVK